MGYDKALFQRAWDDTLVVMGSNTNISFTISVAPFLEHEKQLQIRCSSGALTISSQANASLFILNLRVIPDYQSNKVISGEGTDNSIAETIKDLVSAQFFSNTNQP